MDNDIVISFARRTPMGRFLGSISHLSAPELLALCITQCLSELPQVREAIGEVIAGNVVTAGIGQAPARMAALGGGLPPTVSAVTINKVCGSGLKAVMLAANSVKLGENKVVLAGGMESMSRAPFLLNGLRTGVKFGDQPLIDSVVHDGLWDPNHKTHMGNFADYTAQKAGVTREEQDELAFESHQKATAALKHLQAEMVPVQVFDRKGVLTQTISSDENPRADSSMATLGQLKPAFSKDGTVTAGNASPLTDGAAALLVTSRAEAKRLELPILATITGYTTVGVEPKEIFFAPGHAVKKLTNMCGFESVHDFDQLEVNEAFAAQVLANQKEVGWERKKMNPYGGAIALGHPIGASGARVLVTLINGLTRRGGGNGLATLCLGGGNAVALALKV